MQDTNPPTSNSPGVSASGLLDYSDFLVRKTQLGTSDGFKATFYPEAAFDFQSHLIEWSIAKGRSAVLADCGMGKTVVLLAWAENVMRHTNKPVLIMAPLAVTHQIAREASKFGIEAKVINDGAIVPGINIINYERLHLLDAADFVGAVCDEAGILKSFDGIRRKQITEFMRVMKYRLLCTATAAPNEYIELGTSSEALGYLGYMDMLSKFFKNDQGNSIKPHIARRKGKNFQQLDDAAKWRFKGHAATPFWRWVNSWAIACRKPSDIGFDDGPFQLPPLVEYQHMVDAKKLPNGMMFALPAVGLSEQRDERRRTIEERCGRAADIVKTGKPAAIWCHLNAEGDMLEKLIPDAIQVSGKDAEELKEEKFLSFIDGKSRVLIVKPKIGAWGLNFQHCAHTVSFPSHSYEQYYQQTRRFWRFGQKFPVVSDIITTEGEKSVLQNLQRKSKAADAMFVAMIENMNEAAGISRAVQFTQKEGIPSWL
jgi:hypothetical protein